MASTRKRIVTIAGAAMAVAAVLAAAITIWLIFFSPPGKSDYQNALKRADEMSSASATLNTAFLNYNKAVSTEFRNGKTFAEVGKATADEESAFKSARTAYVVAVETVGEQKAMRNADIQASYDRYLKQDTKYLRYIDIYVANYALYNNTLAGSGCRALFTIYGKSGTNSELAKNHREASKKCVPQLEQLAKSSDKNFAAYAKEYLALVKERQKNFDALASKKITIEQAANRSVELGDVSDRVFDMDPVGKLLEMRADAAVDEVYRDLKSALQAKQKQA